MIEQFKNNYIKTDPDKSRPYTSDVFCKWYQHYFYLCEKTVYQLPGKPPMEKEDNFVRLAFLGNNKFDFSYFRYTSKWHLVAEDISKENCLEMIIGNPNFHPIG